MHLTGGAEGLETVLPTQDEKVYRCDNSACGSPVLDKHIRAGGCAKCGGRRMKLAINVTEEEAAWLESEGYVFGGGWSDEPYLAKH